MKNKKKKLIEKLLRLARVYWAFARTTRAKYILQQEIHGYFLMESFPSWIIISHFPFRFTPAQQQQQRQKNFSIKFLKFSRLSSFNERKPEKGDEFPFE